MTAKRALEKLKQLEADGKLDEVLNVDMLTFEDLKHYSKLMYDRYNDDEKEAMDKLLADRDTVINVVIQVLQCLPPYGSEFIGIIHNTLYGKVQELLKK